MRILQNLNQEWLFTKEDNEQHPMVVNPTTWKKVTLPHTWNLEDILREDNDYYQGKCWYYRNVTIPKQMQDKQLYLEILAASNIAQVYINGQLVGTHETGFSTFRYAINTYLHMTEPNTIVISVDNRDYDYIYPRSADFTFEGGLYRGVNLVAVEQAHFAMEDDGSSGIYITPKIDHNDAQVHIHALCEQAQGCRVQYDIKNQEHKIVAQIEGDANEDQNIIIQNVHLWNAIEDPYLYTLDITLKKDGQEMDALSIPFGVRSITFDSQKGVFLNGIKTCMKGVSRHQDHATTGWATTETEMLEDIALIKEVGSNSIRLAHYQHASKFYDLCDQHGLMVWAEIPLISVMSTNPKAHELCRLQLRELIKQNYNHPAIFCWGISNEITIGGETPLVYENNMDLHTLAHTLDNSRPTTLANMSMVEATSKMNEITDIVGYNHYFGWYGGKSEDMETWLINFHKQQPNACLAISEYGAEGILQYHTLQPRRGDYSEEYQVDYHEKNISIFEKMPWMWGSYVWNMFDFSSKFRDEGGRKAMNNKGLVSFDRKTKKDAFYVYKAHWSNIPFVHINSKRYSKRAEEATTIIVYSNCDEITLQVNGQTIAKQQGTCAFTFEHVQLTSKENHIKAQCGEYVDEMIITKVENALEDYLFEGAKDDVDNWFDEDQGSMVSQEGYYSLQDKIKVLLENEQCKALIEEMIPGFGDNPMLQMAKELPFAMIFGFLKDIPKERAMALNEAIIKIKK